MSASLVGSEMCIRDSVNMMMVMKASAPGDDDESKTGSDAVPRALKGAPVSYTHLTLPTICSV
eukprot:3140547-Alexandrium_andersonii.AAC.1